MFEAIDALDIYNKNINILVGAGASADLFPTLSLKVKGAKGELETIETLSHKFESYANMRTALFMHYYNNCIYPVQDFSPEFVVEDKEEKNLNNYEAFIKTLIGLMDKRKDLSRKVNVFTTNYDGCLTHSADSLLQGGVHDFIVNDGTSGFHKKHLNAKNFNTFQCQTGVFERSSYGIPQINIIHVHGSVYWSKNKDKIEVDYSKDFNNFLSFDEVEKIKEFSNYICTKGNQTDHIPSVSFSPQEIDDFWSKYNQLPIVNPTKWKFNETVFEEHYYQMLRLLSYELEKPNSILITFGFSFADEHILRLIQRSLSNPFLQTFICCYENEAAVKLRQEFGLWKNVKIISPPEGEVLDFSNFNKYIFSLNPENYESTESLGDL
ncbi:SIR2 family protein [Halomonas sp. ISL-56]|uniref:SIR2 family protein n=1 Tax=Halomonas sp. ISL-56 TaxID=2819149 RepID=UPI001BEB36E3|nr:SIR2 family protein [Halomonas sp. ISL-56]MBT2801152.1 SIR2 family protein [Halomonas sp. ISL-56]